MVRAGESRTLVSWSGTMFEYLMPLLIMHCYPNTLLAEACSAAVKEQKTYGRRHKVPWGISECGFSALNVQLHYQYQAFGVPSLGPEEGLGPRSGGCALRNLLGPDGLSRSILRKPQAAGGAGP